MTYLFDNRCALSNPPTILMFVSKTETFMFESKFSFEVSISTTL